MLPSPRVCLVVAWALLLGVFACACAQGNEFAATKDSATAFGCVIGLAAFFGWLGVEDDDDDESEGEEGGGAAASAAKQADEKKKQ